MSEQQIKALGPRWTAEILRRCTPREILVLVAAYGAQAVAQRLEYADIQKFIEDNNVSRPS